MPNKVIVGESHSNGDRRCRLHKHDVVTETTIPRKNESEKLNHHDKMRSQRDEETEEDVEENSPLLPGENFDGSDIDIGREEGQKPHRSHRWPSLAAFVVASVVVLCILVVGFAAPPAIEEYVREAAVIQPTGLELESFTQSGVRLRIQGDFVLDSGRVRKASVRRIGRIGTSLSRVISTKQSRVAVILPEFSAESLGILHVPGLRISVVDGAANHLNFICEIVTQQLDALRPLVNQWIQGTLVSLEIEAVAEVPLTLGFISLGTQTLSHRLIFKGKLDRLVYAMLLNFQSLSYFSTNMLPHLAMSGFVAVHGLLSRSVTSL